MPLSNILGGQLLVDDAGQFLLVFPYELDLLKRQRQHAAFDAVVHGDLEGDRARFSHAPQ